MTLFDRRVEKPMSGNYVGNDEEVLVYLSQYLEEKLTMDDFGLVKLSHMKNLYIQNLKCEESHIHSTRLKERLLMMNNQISAHTLGRNVVFAWNNDVGPALRDARSKLGEDEAVLSKAASILRREIFA